jgi:hypothetical protein
MSQIPYFIRLLIIAVIVSLCIIISTNYNYFWNQVSTDPLTTQKNIPTSNIVKPDLPVEKQSKITQQEQKIEQLPVTPTKTSTVNELGYKTTSAFEQYKPKYTVATIHSSNYGDRYSNDVHGKPLNNQPLAVLHETVGSLASTLNTFQTHHKNDNQQVSYHALISLDGTIIYLVPADKRAFGAGNSVFKSSAGIETVQTNPNLPPSVNNFAYHISLETPPDGRGNRPNHSGYTDGQYQSLAWLLAMSNIPDERITTHQAVDRSGHKFDPRSFDFDKFFNILHSYRQLS